MDPSFRDDGTVVCPIHGLRYDPNEANGCIKCPRTQPPPKRSLAAKASAVSKAPSQAPPRISQPPPSGFAPARAGRASAPPMAPMQMGSSSLPGMSDPHLSILAAPPRKTSRRGLVLGVGAAALAAAGGAAWFVRPQGPQSWAKKVQPLQWSSAMGPRTGAYYACTRSQTEPCSLLVVLDPRQASASVVARYARHAERHGWVVASTDAVGKAVRLEDAAEVQALVEHARATFNVNAARVMLAGYGVAGECAYRVALLEASTFGGAIVECCGTSTWRDAVVFARAGSSFYLVTRAQDPGRDGMLTMKDEMERRGLRVTLDELPGGPQEMGGEELEAPFVWLDAVG